MKKILSQLFDFLRIHYFTVVFLLVTLFFSPKNAILWSGFIILFFIFELIMYFINKLFSDKIVGISIKVLKDNKEKFKFDSITVKWYENENLKLFDLQTKMFNEIREDLGEEFSVDKIEYIKN